MHGGTGDDRLTRLAPAACLRLSTVPQSPPLSCHATSGVAWDTRHPSSGSGREIKKPVYLFYKRLMPASRLPGSASALFLPKKTFFSEPLY
jgi:hypothetical protein